MTITPTRGSMWDGDRFDFGTHVNEFLIRREDAVASEAFLVRVPPRGATPLHVHPDMEQTFVIVSGSGELGTGPGVGRAPVACRAGDVVFIPTDVPHTLINPGL